MCRRRGVRDDRGAGIANDEGGIVMRGDCGLDRDVVLALVCETALSVDEVDEDEADSNDVLRDKAGCEVTGLWIGLSPPISEILFELFSGNLKWLLVPVGKGLIKAVDVFLRKSR
jgi:hypothetical protein